MLLYIDLASEQPHLKELIHRYHVGLFRACHPKLRLPRQPPLKRQLGAGRVVNRDISHHHSAGSLFVPATEVGPARCTGHHHGDSMEFIVAGVKDEAAHAQ